MTYMIRGLWGDETMRKKNRTLPEGITPREELLEQVRKCTWCDIALVYGDENEEFIRQNVGCEIAKISNDPWGSPQLTDEQYPENKHWSAVWGMSTWWHKLKIIEHALEYFGDVVWLDWRASRMQADYAVRNWLFDLSEGHFFRACLSFQRSAKYGAVWRNSSLFNHYVVGGGCIYVRREGLDWIRQAIVNMERHPEWNDQQCLMLAIDQYHGGQWIGTESWLRNLELPGYYYQRNVFYTPSFSTIWQIGDRLKQDEHHAALTKGAKPCKVQ